MSTEFPSDTRTVPAAGDQNSAPSSTITLFKYAAFAEAVGWTILLLGMFLKYVTKTTEMGVKIGGPIHGVLFIWYVLMCLKVWQVKRWPAPTLALSLVSSVIPYMTIWFERRAAKRGEI